MHISFDYKLALKKMSPHYLLRNLVYLVAIAIDREQFGGFFKQHIAPERKELEKY